MGERLPKWKRKEWYTAIFICYKCGQEFIRGGKSPSLARKEAMKALGKHKPRCRGRPN
jgi:ribosomal protein L37AE/L43A